MLTSVYQRRNFKNKHVTAIDVNQAVDLMRTHNVKKMLWEMMTKRDGKPYRMEILIKIKEGYFND